MEPKFHGVQVFDDRSESGVCLVLIIGGKEHEIILDPPDAREVARLLFSAADIIESDAK